MYKKVLLAYDGSPTADHALREAARLVTDGAVLLVATVVDNPTATIPAVYGVRYDLGIVARAMQEAGRAALDQAVADLAKRGIAAESRLIDLTAGQSNNVSAALLQLAGEWQADVVVIGTHGRGGLKRLLLGSVAEALIRTASLPVLLVRGPAVEA